MDIQNLKQYILDNNKIPMILESIACHDIQHKDGYYSCANPDGDNKNAIQIYENKSLITIDHTRDIANGRNSSDIFTLVEFFKKISFFNALKYVCDCIGLDYYHDFDEDIPESLKLTKLILQMEQGDNSSEDEKPLKPIDEKILSYYKPYVNDMFKNDGISYQTQKLFEIGYDDESNRITIPIRDELGTLVGIKGRLLKKELDEDELKYLYLEPCGRSKILFGLDKTYQYIKRENKCYVTEAEKAPMQLWDMGYCNSIATGGKKVSNTQIEKLTRLCVDLIFLFDKDVKKEEIQDLANRFIDGTNIYAVVDDKNVLEEKESPTDSKEKFEYLIHNCLRKIK